MGQPVLATTAAPLRAALADDLDALVVHLRYPLRHRRRWRQRSLLERSLGGVKRRTKVGTEFTAPKRRDRRPRSAASACASSAATFRGAWIFPIPTPAAGGTTAAVLLAGFGCPTGPERIELADGGIAGALYASRVERGRAYRR